ncbi:MAG: Yip1 family protein [Thermoproteota archaeon]
MYPTEETLKERHESLLIRFFKRTVLTIKNPKGAFLQIKDSPDILAIVIIPLIIVGLTFLQYYAIYRLKMNVPAPLYTNQIDSFINSMIQIRLIQYAFYMLFGISLAWSIFMVGRWLKGQGDFKQGLSITGYAHVPNILGLIVAILLILSLPTVQTSVLTFVGYPVTEPLKDNIVLDLKNYVGDESNLTIVVRAHYSIPLNATMADNGTIIGATKILSGEISGFYSEINITYIATTSTGTNRTVKIIPLNDVILDYNKPITMKNIFNSSEYVLANYGRTFTVDLTLFLNNTYILPVQENMSIPYIITLKVFSPDMGVKSHEIKSSFYTEVKQYPDPRSLNDVLSTGFNVAMQVLLIVVTIWQVILFAAAFKIIHEISWIKALILIIIYVVAKYLLTGFAL